MQTHASWLLLKYALDKEGELGGEGGGGGLGYVRVVWWCDEGNGPSERAAERLGMEREGVLVSPTRQDGNAVREISCADQLLCGSRDGAT